MPGPRAVPTRPLQDLVAEVRLLHDRLHRVAVALALSEDLLAVTLEELSTTPGCDPGRYRMQANRARMAAEECRGIARRIDDLHPDSNASVPPWDNPFPDGESRLR